MEDIQKEVVLYKEYFKDKVVLCNCDDPFESHFFKLYTGGKLISRTLLFFMLINPLS